MRCVGFFFLVFFLKQALREHALQLKFSACAKGLFVELSSEKITCDYLSTGLGGYFWGMVVAVEVKREESAKQRPWKLRTSRLGREGSGRAASPPRALSERSESLAQGKRTVSLCHPSNLSPRRT